MFFFPSFEVENYGRRDIRILIQINKGRDRGTSMEKKKINFSGDFICPVLTSIIKII